VRDDRGVIARKVRRDMARGQVRLMWKARGKSARTV